MLDNITAKDFRHYKLIGYGLYGVGGWLGFVNMEYTAKAYAAQGMAAPLPWLAAAAYTLIEAGAFSFLLSPNTWGELARAFRSEVQEAVSPFVGTPRTVAAVLLAFICVLMVGTTALTVWADWQSTADGLRLTTKTGQAANYIGTLALVLVLGTEVCGVWAHQVLRLARRHAISQHQESSTFSPAETYAAEHAKAARAAAKAKAKAAAQHWGNPR